MDLGRLTTYWKGIYKFSKEPIGIRNFVIKKKS